MIRDRLIRKIARTDQLLTYVNRVIREYSNLNPALRLLIESMREEGQEWLQEDLEYALEQSNRLDAKIPKVDLEKFSEMSNYELRVQNRILRNRLNSDVGYLRETMRVTKALMAEIDAAQESRKKAFA